MEIKCLRVNADKTIVMWCQVRSGQVRSGQVRSGQVRSGQVRSGQVRSGQVRSGQVKGLGVHPCSVCRKGVGPNSILSVSGGFIKGAVAAQES